MVARTVLMLTGKIILNFMAVIKKEDRIWARNFLC